MCGSCPKSACATRTPAKDEVRLVPLTDISYVRQMESWMITTRPRRREPLWAVTDETMRNWLKQAVRRAEADGVHFSIPVTPHTFRHSYIMHMLYHRQPRKVIRALAGHRDPRSMEVYTRVLRWIWLPRWQCLSQVTGAMLQRSCVHCLPEVTAYALPYISGGKQNRHNISYSR